jgi:acyl carrier protein
MPTITDFNQFQGVVLDAVRESLGEHGDGVGERTPLLDLPGFDSMAIATVVERVEDRTGVEVDPDALVPETFSSVRTLAMRVWPGERPTAFDEVSPYD